MLRSLILVCCLLLASVVEAEKEPIVIIISMDGVPHYIADNPLLTAFKHMEKYGIKADHLTPVYQSTTYPSHVSMATGVYPDRHGILHNSFIDTQQLSLIHI